MFTLYFNGKSNMDLGASITSRPKIPAPKKEYDEYKVIGKSGKVYRDKGTYEDISIQVQFNYMSESDIQWQQDFRQIKKWLTQIEDNKLSFSDDTDYFYKVKTVTLSDCERKLKRKGIFTATFICDPYMYYIEGQKQRFEKPTSKEIYNDFCEAHPVYEIGGSGTCVFNINGKKIYIHSPGNVRIDTERMICILADGTIDNAVMQGKYEDMFLKEGKNTISTNGYAYYITPNWRNV